MANESQERGVSSWVWWVVGGVAALLVLYWIFSVPSQTPTEVSTTETPTGQEGQPGVPNTGSGGSGGSTNLGAATVTSIIQNPSAFDRSVVSVRGVVGNVYQSRVMILNETGSVGGRTGLLVVSPRASTVATGQEVTVTGTVRSGVVRDVLNELGLSVPTGAETMVSERAVLVADSITTGEPQ